MTAGRSWNRYWSMAPKRNNYANKLHVVFRLRSERYAYDLSLVDVLVLRRIIILSPG